MNHCDALAVLRPRSTEEISAALRLCHTAAQPVVTEGGKTGLVTGALAGPGEIALSLERMNRIEQLDATQPHHDGAGRRNLAGRA